MSKYRRNQGIEQEISARDLENTYFVPMKRINDVLGIREARRVTITSDKQIRCDYNLLDLKHERSTREYFDETVERYCSARHRSLFVSSCYKALYAHDWDRLLYILKRVPKWKIKDMHVFHTRVLTVLLMYHPDSQAKGILNEYIHMVWGCRLDQDKKAIQKVILTLDKKMFRAGSAKLGWIEDLTKRKKSFVQAFEDVEINENGCEE